jgi:hypothetical protein
VDRSDSSIVSFLSNATGRDAQDEHDSPRITHVPDDLPHRQWQILDQRGGGNDLPRRRLYRLMVDIGGFEVVRGQVIQDLAALCR